LQGLPLAVGQIAGAVYTKRLSEDVKHTASLVPMTEEMSKFDIVHNAELSDAMAQGWLQSEISKEVRGRI